MARGAAPSEDFSATCCILTLAVRGGIYSLQTADVSSDIGDILQVGQMVLVGEVPHARIRAVAGTKIDEGSDNDSQMLTGDGRNGSIADTNPRFAVTRSTRVEKLLPVRHVRLQMHYGTEFPISSGISAGRQRCTQQDQRAQQDLKLTAQERPPSD